MGFLQPFSTWQGRKSPEFRSKHLRVDLRTRGEIRPGAGVSLLGSLGSPATTSSVDHMEVSSLLGIFPRDATGWGRWHGAGQWVWTDAPSHVAGMAMCSGVLFRGHIWRKEVHLMLLTVAYLLQPRNITRSQVPVLSHPFSSC